MSLKASKVRYWDYLAEYNVHRTDYMRAVDDVFSSGRLVLGQQVARLEAQLAAYCGVTAAVGVNSCTDAIFLALKALGIGPGDEVITVSNTAVPTVAAIRATGATPVFVDVEEDTYLMDAALVEARLTGRSRCIVPVHLCGQMVDMEPLLTLARQNNLRIVEDCAQACGALYHGKRAGSLGDAGAFSFYPTKVLGACGDGGAITTSNPDLALRLKRLRMYGMDDSYYAEEEGYNSRLDEVQAAILNLRLPGLDAAIERRRRIARLYDEGLAGIDGVGLPAVREGRMHQFYLYTIRTARRDELMNHLAEQGIESKINYPWPIHLMRGYAFLGGQEGDLPVTERLASTILSLPIYPELPEDDVAKVVDAVRRFFRGCS
jgi:dTDP-4-amino-4,6-dideoxygalactose transaminase